MLKKNHFQTLGTLQGEETGSVSVKIRTTETSGIILYNTGQVKTIIFFLFIFYFFLFFIFFIFFSFFFSFSCESLILKNLNKRHKNHPPITLYGKKVDVAMGVWSKKKVIIMDLTPCQINVSPNQDKSFWIFWLKAVPSALRFYSVNGSFILWLSDSRENWVFDEFLTGQEYKRLCLSVTNQSPVFMSRDENWPMRGQEYKALCSVSRLLQSLL